MERHHPKLNEEGEMPKKRYLIMVTLAVMVLLLVALPMLGACTTEKVVEVPVEKVVEKEVVKRYRSKRWLSKRSQSKNGQMLSALVARLWVASGMF